jgi:hypothetical protein
MNALEAEAYIKSQLDGNLFSLIASPGFEGGLIVTARKVGKDHIPDHRPPWSPDMEGGEIHHNSTPFTPEQDEKLLQLRFTGMRWREVGTAIGRCVNSTRDRYQVLCKERGIDPGPARLPRPPKVSDAIKLQAYHLKQDGLSYSQIGKKLGLTMWQAADAVLQVKKRKAAA